MVRGSSLQRELRSTSKGEKKKMLPALQGAGVFSEAKKAVPPSSGMDRQDRVMIFIVFDNILYPALIILTDVTKQTLRPQIHPPIINANYNGWQ